MVKTGYIYSFRQPFTLHVRQPVHVGQSSRTLQLRIRSRRAIPYHIHTYVRTYMPRRGWLIKWHTREHSCMQSKIASHLGQTTYLSVNLSFKIKMLKKCLIAAWTVIRETLIFFTPKNSHVFKHFQKFLEKNQKQTNCCI